jgi:hypothetical protein
MTNADIERDDDDETPKEGRGPAYPYIALEQAIERADKVREAGLARSALPRAAFFKIWDYKGASGPARQTIAALKYYSLVDYIGSGKDRKVRLTELALRIVLDKVPGSSERAKAVREAALAPAIFADLLKQFPFGIGTDSGIETYLTLNKSYSEAAAKHIISVFRDTLHFAGLDKPVNMPDPDPGAGDENPLPAVAVGDFVQVEIDGALQLEKAARIRAIQQHEGKDWVFIEGSETGIPMTQIVVEKKAAEGPPSGGTPPRLPEEKRAPQPGMKEEKNSLDEGEATLVWPENLSPESVQDLEYWLTGILNKAKRRAGV